MGSKRAWALSRDESKELSFSFFRDWWLAATQALVNEAGHEMALEMLRPYFVNTGVAGAINIQRILGIDAEELIRRETPIFFYQLIQNSAKIRVFKAKDGSSMWEVRDCATGGICREGCQCFCEITPSAYIDALREGEFAFLKRSISFGDPSCQIVFHSNSETFMVAARQEFELTKDQFPLPTEDGLNEYLSFSFIGESWSNATRGLIDFAGPERALERLRPHLRLSGLSLGIRLSERFSGMRGSHESIVEIIGLVQLLHQRKGTLSSTEEGAEGIVTECPLSASPPEICLQYEAFFNGVCEAIDPCYEFKYDRMMTRGDSNCHWTMRRKGEAGKEEGMGCAAHESDETALELLKKRLVKGEVTPEQYRQLRDLLLEK